MGQDPGGQIFAFNPGQDQKTAVVDHPMKMRFSLGIAPADELVAAGHTPGGGTKSQKAHQVLSRVDEKAHLRPAHAAIAQIMVALDQFIEKGGRFSFDHLQAKLDAAGIDADGRLGISFFAADNLGCAADFFLHRRQPDKAAFFKAQKRHPAAHLF